MSDRMKKSKKNKQIDRTDELTQGIPSSQLSDLTIQTQSKHLEETVSVKHETANKLSISLDNSNSQCALKADNRLSTQPEMNSVCVARRPMVAALFRAVIACRPSKVRFLLTRGLDPQIENDLGQNLLVATLYISHSVLRKKMFKYLLRQWNVRSLGAVDKKTGRDVIHWAAYLGRDEQVTSTDRIILG